MTTDPNVERRSSNGRVELRRAPGKTPVVRGYAAVFNKRSANLGTAQRELYEVIEPGAFDDVMNDDVRALFNHNPDAILARSKGGRGSLRLFVDQVGLGYEFDLPDTQSARDLAISLDRGDITESSFGFSLKKGGDSWSESNGVTVRTIEKGGIGRLLDVSPVTYPAYPDTAVAFRSLNEFRSHKPANRSLEWYERRFAQISTSRPLVA